ncbi:heparan-alpha-glucosaminide N-acetyltransferase domain-containing protein, partial [Tenacibaculum sp.]|nr:heparan-alpha-glucosaminide N-acetyltransferase domain-containing protein [Tenacibaculum sp.]
TGSNLFFTRLLAHLCAPIFVFLTGLSVWLYSNPKSKPSRSATSFLLKRGFFLILLELTLINFSWSASYHTLYLQVIWAIGVSMISLAFLSKIPRVWIGILGVIIVFGHNLLTPITFNTTEFGYNFWTIFHDRGYLVTDGFINIRASYPVLPWIGVILLGYFTGPLYHHLMPAVRRQKKLILLGLSSLALLLILRGWNIYGETLPWGKEDSVLKSVASFLNYTKYPPSLHFLLFTLGIGFLLLSYFEKINGWFSQVLKVFGSAPMFFYIVHLYVLLVFHGILIFTINDGKPIQVNYVYQLWLISILISVLLYFPTKKFANYKRRSTSKLIKYF